MGLHSQTRWHHMTDYSMAPPWCQYSHYMYLYVTIVHYCGLFHCNLLPLALFVSVHWLKKLTKRTSWLSEAYCSVWLKKDFLERLQVSFGEKQQGPPSRSCISWNLTVAGLTPAGYQMGLGWCHAVWMWSMSCPVVRVVLVVVIVMIVATILDFISRITTLILFSHTNCLKKHVFLFFLQGKPFAKGFAGRTCADTQSTFHLQSTIAHSETQLLSIWLFVFPSLSHLHLSILDCIILHVYSMILFYSIVLYN